MNWFIALGYALSSPVDNIVSFLFAWALVFIGLYFAHELFVYLGEMLDAAQEEVQKKATKDSEEKDATKMEKIKQRANKVKERSKEREKTRETKEQAGFSRTRDPFFKGNVIKKDDQSADNPMEISLGVDEPEAGEQASSSEEDASEQREQTLSEKNEREIRKHFPEN